MPDDLLPTLIPYFGCVIQRSADRLQLTGASRNHMNAAAITPRTFSAPITLRVVAKDRFDEPAQNWEFTCRDVRTYTLRYLPIESFEFVSKHTLLVPYTAPWASLSFVGRPVSPSALVGELREAHRKLTEGWFRH